jgi:hypothetical protein
VLPDKIARYLYEYHADSYASHDLPVLPADRSTDAVPMCMGFSSHIRVKLCNHADYYFVITETTEFTYVFYSTYRKGVYWIN